MSEESTIAFEPPADLKWLIWGSKGWIGGQVVDLLSQNYPSEQIIAAKSRADQEDQVEAEIRLHKPNRLVCLIGRTHGPNKDDLKTIDYLEQPGKLQVNVRDNLYAPLVLAQMAQKYGLHLTYLGTGCIFTYIEDQEAEINIPDETSILREFSEEDRPNFFGSGYSTVKGFTDRLMHMYTAHVLNCRIRMPITGEPNPRNLITKLLNYQKICSLPNSMSVLPELLPVMLDLAAKHHTGTINLTNPGFITHNQILDMYRELVDPEYTYQNFSLGEQSKILLSGRSNNVLKTDKLHQLYPEIPHLKESIRRLMQNYPKKEN